MVGRIAHYNVNAAGGKDVSEVSLIVEPRNLTFAKKPVSRVSQSFQCRP